MRLIAIMGGDWLDASVDFLEIPDGMDIKEMKLKYDKWYKNEYNPNRSHCKYLSLSEFLKLNGVAIETNKIEEYWETQ